MTMVGLPDRPLTLASDEMVVLQLLEEIYHLILPNANGVLPSTLRLQAAAKLYLDTRDTFETIERNVEGLQHDKPKLLRKLSKRRSVGVTPRQSFAEVSVTPRASTTLPTARPNEASGSQSARTDPSPPSRRSSNASQTNAEVMNEEINDEIVDRIQDMFRHLGDKLSRPILDELRHRNVPIQTALHYVRFLPAASQWTAYMEKRDEEVRLAHNPQRLLNETLLQQLKRNAEFIKEQIRKDVNMVCLFSADGTLSTIFGDDLNTDSAAVAEKFEVLIRDVYAKYLYTIIDNKMDQLLRVSDQWQQDMAVLGSSSATMAAPQAHLYVRARKFRSKIPIFPHAITAIDERATMPVLPQVPPGTQVRVLVADLNHLGLWWQKTILAATERDVTTVHTDETRGIAGVNASLDGQMYVPLMYDNYNDFVRKYARNGGLAKLQDHRLLVNNGKDSLWVEVTVLEVEDGKRCKLQLKKSLEKSTETLPWQQYLASQEWIQLKDLKLCLAPLNPCFRIHMGLKFRTMIDVFQSLVTEISSIFPNEDLEHQVGKSLWESVEPSFSRGEHVFARYFRSILNQDLQPKRPTGTLTERSSSIVTATASMRNLVAALEHSSYANSMGSLSGPSTGTAPSSAAQPPIRRLSLSLSNNQNLLGRSVDHAYFDDKGAYHYQFVVLDPPLRTTTSGSKTSPFDKLAHHLVEEKEMIGGCIQNNNIALGRAFAQVLQEKLTRLAKQIQMRLEQDETSAIEAVIIEYASACRFFYTWRIVRHELDTVAKQRRGKRDRVNAIHSEWVDRSFQRMEALVGMMVRLQLQHLQRMFFHEFSRNTLSGIGGQDWTASKPWFSHSRCTYAIQSMLFRVHTLFDGVILRVLGQYERVLCVHEKMHEMASWLVVDLVACIASLYETMVVSRARLPQWKIDILYFVSGVYTLLRLLDKMLSSTIAPVQHRGRGGKEPVIEIRERCLRLLGCLALRCGPANAVADEVIARVDSHAASPLHVDAITEFEVHIAAIRTAMGIRHQSSVVSIYEDDSSVWTSHNVFGDVEIKRLADVELNWAALISRSNLSPEALLASLHHRHELGEWLYPPLTDDQVKDRSRLQESVHEVEAHLQQIQMRELDATTTGFQPRDKPPSRTGTPDEMTPSLHQSPSLQGPAMHGERNEEPQLPNNPMEEEQTDPSPMVRPASSGKPLPHVEVSVATVDPSPPDSSPNEIQDEPSVTVSS